MFRLLCPHIVGDVAFRDPIDERVEVGRGFQFFAVVEEVHEGVLHDVLGVRFGDSKRQAALHECFKLGVEAAVDFYEGFCVSAPAVRDEDLIFGQARAWFYVVLRHCFLSGVLNWG